MLARRFEDRPGIFDHHFFKRMLNFHDLDNIEPAKIINQHVDLAPADCKARVWHRNLRLGLRA